MTGPDDEFEEFLNRRKSVFRRNADEMFEPPAEIDRVVLRQAREAIEPPEPMRVFSGPRWSMPIALAATLLLAFTIIFKAGMPPTKSAAKPEVTVQNVVERVDAPEVASAAPATQEQATLEQERAAPAAESAAGRSVADATSRRMAGASATMDAAPAEAAPAPAEKAGEVPPWRRDQKSWLAEIQRLRDAGNTARADAEYAELKRQQRAYAVAPDR
jgi:hypothetical protein